MYFAKVKVRIFRILQTGEVRAEGGRGSWGPQFHLMFYVLGQKNAIKPKNRVPS
jgi:hypothetical protein